MKKLVLIDSNAIIHRAYHALPKTMSTRSGEPTNAVYGFATALIKVLEDIKPDYIAASFDLAGPTFRHEHYADYKATRVKADQELYDQIPRVKEMLSIMEIPIYEKEGYEADDTIGTIVRKVQDTNDNNQTKSKRDSSPAAQNDNRAMKQSSNETMVYIVSGDKDIFQLIDGNIKVYNLRRGLSDTQIVDREVIEKEYHLQPEDFIDLKALAGDASDNIPGVPGIGPKTATELLQDFDSLEKLYKAIETKEPKNSSPDDSEMSGSRSKHRETKEQKRAIARSEATKQSDANRLPHPGGLAMTESDINKIAKELKLKPRIVQLLIEYKDQAFMSQKLATIHKEVPIEFSLDDAKWGEYDKANLRKFFEDLNFKSLLRRFGIIDSDGAKSSHQPTAEQQRKDSQLKLL